MKSLKNLFKPTDMTEGKPWKSIMMFAIPMLIGNVAQQLYSTVDSVVVGKYVGDNALAAVGSALPLFNLLLVFIVGISAGVGIMVSQYFGARAKEDLSKTIGTCITLTAVVSLIMMILAPVVVKPILHLMNTPAEIFNDCAQYLIIIMYGIAGMAYYNILSGILRGLGDSFSALLYLLVSTIINIFLDILFVAKFNMGVAGVSVATVIAQFISSILCFVKLMNMKDLFELKKHHFAISKNHISQIMKLGLPTGMTQAIFSSAMLVVQSLTNQFGTEFIAANVIVMRVDGFAVMPSFSFGTAMTTYAGQNVGAKKFDRVKLGAKQGTLMAVFCSVLITIIILFFGKYLMAIFTETASLVDLSVYLMRILAVGYIGMAITQSLSGVMRGAGDTMTPMWISLIATIFLRIPIAYGISYLTKTPELPYGRCECIQVSLLITWVMGAVLTCIFYRLGKWKNKAIMK